MERKTFLRNIILIVITALIIKLYLFSLTGPIYFGDSVEYLEVMNNIHNGHGFSLFDIVEKKLMPYSNKMPIFFYLGAYSLHILRNNLPLNIVIINTIAHSIIIILIIKLSFMLFKNHKLSLLSGLIAAVLPEYQVNSLMIMPDILYSMIILTFTVVFIKALSGSKNTYPYFISGILLGISILTRAVLKFFWIIIAIFLLIQKSERGFKTKIIIAFLTGYLLIILPYHVRNYLQLKIITPLELHQGVAATWPIIPLIKNTDYTPLEKRYPNISKITKLIENYSMPPEEEIMLKFNLNTIEISKILTTISLYTIKSNPIGYLKIYLKQLFNTITSPSSYLLIIDFMKPGFFEKQHQELMIFLKDKILTKNVSLNILFRFINLIFTMLTIYGIALFIKNKQLISTTSFIIILYSYTILFSSLTVGYDRYRVPVEFVKIIFLSYALLTLFKKFILKINV